MSAALDRLHRHRQREALGLAVLPIEVDFNALSFALLEAGFIQEHQIDDRAAVAAANEEIKPLQRRIAELETKQLNYREVWSETELYGERDLVTHGGNLWICKSATHMRPGTSKDWRMMTKEDKLQQPRLPTIERTRHTNVL